MNSAILQFTFGVLIAFCTFGIQHSTLGQIYNPSGCGESVCGFNFECGGNGGPGTEMTKIINRIGLGADCGRCKSLAAKMDQGGPNWVRHNFEFVVRQTINNAERLGHRMGPVRKTGVRIIVRTSNRRARFKQRLR